MIVVNLCVNNLCDETNAFQVRFFSIQKKLKCLLFLFQFVLYFTLNWWILYVKESQYTVRDNETRFIKYSQMRKARVKTVLQLSKI